MKIICWFCLLTLSVSAFPCSPDWEYMESQVAKKARKLFSLKSATKIKVALGELGESDLGSPKLGQAHLESVYHDAIFADDGETCPEEVVEFFRFTSKERGRYCTGMMRFKHTADKGLVTYLRCSKKDDVD